MVTQLGSRRPVLLVVWLLSALACSQSGSDEYPSNAATSISGEDLGTVQSASSVTVDRTKRWPDNRIDYYIHDSVGSTGPVCPPSSHTAPGPNVEALRDSLKAYERLTALQFVEHCWPPQVEDTRPHLIYVVASEGPSYTYSFTSLKQKKNDPSDSLHEHAKSVWAIVQGLVRPAGGSVENPRREDMIIGFAPPKLPWKPIPNGFAHETHVVLHETGHALGMFHEQKRHDAEDHIYINECCMEDGPTNAFDVVSEDSDILLAPYDFESVMQYPSHSKCLEKDGQCVCSPILAKKDLGYTDKEKITCGGNAGQSGYLIDPKLSLSQGGLSAEDLNTIGQMYPADLGDNESGDDFGGSMASGDFDGDGYDDLAVGAAGEGVDGQPAAGAVLVFKGTMNGLVPWHRLTVKRAGLSAGAGDYFGRALTAVKLNGDPRAELVVGAPGRNVEGWNTGAVFVFYGGREGLTHPQMLHPGNTGFTPSESNGDEYGAALASGDFDDDGWNEIVIGAPGKSRVYLVRHDFTRYAGLGVERVPEDQFGFSLAVGRMNGDQKDDLIVGSPEGGRPNAPGSVYMALGQSDGLGSPHRVREPAQDPDGGDRFGEAVAVGRFFSDAGPRLVVGAPGRIFRKGRVFVMPDLVVDGDFRSPDDFSVLSLAQDVQRVGDEFGKVLTVGRFLTQRDDLVVGVPDKRDSGGGLVVFFAGQTEKAGLLREGHRTAPHDQLGQMFGSALASGQFNAHANLDLAIGARGKLVYHSTSNGRTKETAGAAWVLRGFTDSRPGYGDNPEEFYGYLDQEFTFAR